MKFPHCRATVKVRKPYLVGQLIFGSSLKGVREAEINLLDGRKVEVGGFFGDSDCNNRA